MIKQSFDRIALLAALLAWPATSQAGLFEEAVEGKEEQAETAEEGQDTPDFFSPSRVEFDGYVRGDLYLGKVPEEDVTEIKNGYGEVSAQLKIRLGEWGDGLAEARVSQGYDGSQVQGAFQLREAYANLYLGPLDIRFGHQIIAWGRADGFNPTDNLTPRDMRVRSPNEDDRRAANLALRITTNLRPLRWEMIYLPFFAPSHFPAFDLPGPLALDEPGYPDTDFEHGILASRLHVELASIDFSASYLFGYATFPGIGFVDLDPFGPEGPALSVQFRAFQHHVVGADFSTTVGDLFGLRGEVALRWPKEEGFAEHVPLPDLQYVLGIDREFGDLYVIVQYVGRTVLRWKQLEDTGLLDLVGAEEPPPELIRMYIEEPDELFRLVRVEVARKTRMVHQQTERFSHSGFLRLQYKLLQETLTLEVMGLVNFSTEEVLVVPRVTYSITDGLTLTAGAEIYGGPEGTLFGTVEEIQSAAFLELKAFF